MRSVLTGLMFLFTGMAVFAQQSTEQKVEFMDAKANAVVIKMEGQEKNVETVMKNHFAELKGKSEKGWRAYYQSAFKPVSNQVLDIYWDVDALSDHEVMVKMVFSKEQFKYLSHKDDEELITNAKKFLDKLVTDVRAYEYQMAIEAQTRVLELAEKERLKLEEQGKSLEEQKTKILQEIELNKSAQEAKVLDIEKQRQLLQQLKDSLAGLKQQ